METNPETKQTNRENGHSGALEEYKIVHQRIEGYDTRCLLIKSWSITLSAAALGVDL